MIIGFRKRFIMFAAALSLLLLASIPFGHPSCASTIAASPMAPAEDMTAQRLVAHACGAYDGITYTNSLNALDENYRRGFRLFEIDFNLTSDGRIVLLHDWNGTAKKLFGTGGKAFSYSRFKSLKAVHRITLMDIDSLASWLKAHSDAYVVTDCKAGNLGILKTISVKYAYLTQRLYVQMGPFEEYDRLRQMGYGNIILALYRTNYTDTEVLKFVQNHKLFAVSMWANRAQTSLAEELKMRRLKVYAHVVNSSTQYGHLLKNGVYGIYTDSIAPLRKA